MLIKGRKREGMGAGPFKLTTNSKENMVVDPSRDRPDALRTKNVESSITDLTVNPTGRGEPKIVAGVDGILIIIEQLDDQARPLIRDDGDGAVSLSDVADRGLRSGG